MWEKDEKAMDIELQQIYLGKPIFWLRGACMFANSTKKNISFFGIHITVVYLYIPFLLALDLV